MNKQQINRMLSVLAILAIVSTLGMQQTYAARSSSGGGGNHTVVLAATATTIPSYVKYMMQVSPIESVMYGQYAGYYYPTIINVVSSSTLAHVSGVKVNIWEQECDYGQRICQVINQVKTTNSAGQIIFIGRYPYNKYASEQGVDVQLLVTITDTKGNLEASYFDEKSPLFPLD